MSINAWENTKSKPRRSQIAWNSMPEKEGLLLVRCETLETK
jgi:hypothetical protein